MLGQDSSPSSVEVFGGKLMKLNIFGKELTADEVAELYTSGRCSDVEKEHQEVRFITWEGILSRNKTGNVTEVDSGCPVPEGTSQNETEEVDKEETEEKEGKHECECPDKAYSVWDLMLSETYLNQTLTVEMLSELKAVWNVLDNFVGMTVTKGMVRHMKTFHSKVSKTGCDK